MTDALERQEPDSITVDGLVVGPNMIRYWREQVAELDAAKQRIAELEGELSQARNTNRNLHRRVQEAEGPRTSEIAALKQKIKIHADSASSSFRRMIVSHDGYRPLFVAAGKLKGFAAKFHSIMDHRCDGAPNDTTQIWGNFYPNYPKGGITAMSATEAVNLLLEHAETNYRTGFLSCQRRAVELAQNYEVTLDGDDPFGNLQIAQAISQLKPEGDDAAE